MTSERLCPKEYATRELTAEEAETMALWTKVLDRANRSEFNEQEKKLIDNLALSSYVLHEEPGGGPMGDYMMCSEIENRMEYNTKTVAEVAMRTVIMGTVEETIGDRFNVGFDKPKKGIKMPVRIMVERASMDFNEKGCLDTNFVQNVDEVATSTGFINALTRQVVESTLLFMLTTAIVKDWRTEW